MDGETFYKDVEHKGPKPWREPCARILPELS